MKPAPLADQTTTERTPDVSVVMATLNEEDCISQCIIRIKQQFVEMNVRGEIILADNSEDRTPELAKAAGARVVTPNKMGYGHACIYAISNARGRFVVMGDADGTYDFGDLQRFLKPLLEGDADFVFGSRYKGEIIDGSMPWLHRYIGNPFLTCMLNLVLRTNVTDAHCGFRSFSKPAWDQLKKDHMSEDFCSEMLRQIKLNAYVVKEIPIRYNIRVGKPKAGTLIHGYRCFSFLFWRILLNR